LIYSFSSFCQLTDGRYEKFNESLRVNAQSFHTYSNVIREFFRRYFADVADLIALRSAEGILGGGLDAKLAEAPEEVVQAWSELMFEGFSTNEEHLGCADHLLAVLRKK